MLNAISPIDGRYVRQTMVLQPFFSEFALIRYRVWVEIEYFIALVKLPLPQLSTFDRSKFAALRNIYETFSIADAEKVKQLERVTNHDVKAVEYFLREVFDGMGIGAYKEFIHFALTSQDINNTAIPMSIAHAHAQITIPSLQKLIAHLAVLAEAWRDIPMLARTHGQAASPTRLGKEIPVFVVRLEHQLKTLETFRFSGKFGGATGNFNAHHAAFPNIDWAAFANHFLEKHLHLQRQHPTTQIEHYDDLAYLFQFYERTNTILTDFCRDAWAYISMDYFKQKVVAGEVGSSAMPHKVNPIDFENAEGNLGIANAIFAHLAAKLPISRLQRDLTDSTVLRNVGVPLAHTLIAYNSILRGLDKLILNPQKLEADLSANVLVVAEAIQTVLRSEGFDNPYDLLKQLTRGKTHISQQDIGDFIDTLAVSDTTKARLKTFTPHNYLGL